MKPSEVRHLNYVNAEMDRLYELCTELYESLADKDSAEVTRACNRIEYRLRDIKKSHENK